ncbi:molybdopterin-guanine dinucleotide biosynthesis protein MobB [Methanocaldococcus villosus KIN24-T80]|uniref:Molybdopterin-guanine dinucleotide biosynthesis protein MobB n=1 Tax=Methanocaldococcus villosus KIN24-T80 TaxID=1069083 RepID=N6UUY7_9EURY|nr:molybdopterin-guanine dinucleotide biosynthesis protein B [Methanocaldococcus villosus]ENN96174.1 molybdopterin-guanine dinucleotide biosynthesis protein MobB [Methanocaldococcus villosus KIN24-T80]
MRVIGVIGYKNSGKTKLIEDIISNWDKKIAVIKHTIDDIDLKGKDSYRFRDAGAKISIISSDKETVFFLNKLNLDEILGILMGYDIDFVIIEGFKDELKKLNIPKIVLLKNGDDKLIDEQTAYVIKGDYNIDEVIKIIEEKAIIPSMNLNCGHCGYNCETFVKALCKNEVKWDQCVLSNGIKIIVDNKIIPTVPFVSKIIGRSLIAMLECLKGVNKPKHVKIIIDTKKLKNI